MGTLMRKALQNDDGTYIYGGIRKNFDQASIAKKYGGPLMADFEGYCLAATVLWLLYPERTENSIGTMKFDTDAMKLQKEYENSQTSFSDYLAKKFPELKNPICKDNLELTPEELYKKIIYFNDHEFLTKARIIIGIFDNSSSGHALGTIIDGKDYHFIDVNEGVCCCVGESSFWYFIYYYLTNEGGLLDQGYTKFHIALYNPET